MFAEQRLSPWECGAACFEVQMEQMHGSASAFEHSRDQDGPGDLSVVLAEMVGMLLS